MYRFSVGIAVVVTTLATGIATYFLTRGSSSSTHGLNSLTIAIASAAGAVGVVAAVVTGFTTFRSTRTRTEYRERITGIADSLGSGSQTPPDLGDAPAPDDEELIVARYVAERTAAEEAELRLAAYLPANPRRAKRLINHERLYRLIGEYRGVFGGEPELTYDHMARWSLIVEEWPRLGAALTRDPSMMSRLEVAVGIAGLQQTLGAEAPGVKATGELFNLLCGDDGVRLSPVLARIVRFETAPGPAPAAMAGPAQPVQST